LRFIVDHEDGYVVNHFWGVGTRSNCPITVDVMVRNEEREMREGMLRSL
jgi:hypothetical protein